MRKANGLIRQEDLERLTALFAQYRERFPTMPQPARVVSGDALENAAKLIRSLHPDGEPNHHVVLVEPAGYDPTGREWPEGTVTLCVTGNGLTSPDNADMIAEALWFFPELLRSAQYAREWAEQAPDNDAIERAARDLYDFILMDVEQGDAAADTIARIAETLRGLIDPQEAPKP